MSVEKLKKEIENLTYKKFMLFTRVNTISVILFTIITFVIILCMYLFISFTILSWIPDEFIKKNMSDIVWVNNIYNSLMFVMYHCIKPITYGSIIAIPLYNLYIIIRNTYFKKIYTSSMDKLTNKEKYERFLEHKRDFLKREIMIKDNKFNVKVKISGFENEIVLNEVNDDEIKINIIKLYDALRKENPIFEELKTENISLYTRNGDNNLYTRVFVRGCSFNVCFNVVHI